MGLRLNIHAPSVRHLPQHRETGAAFQGGQQPEQVARISRRPSGQLHQLAPDFPLLRREAFFIVHHEPQDARRMGRERPRLGVFDGRPEVVGDDVILALQTMNRQNTSRTSHVVGAALRLL